MNFKIFIAIIFLCLFYITSTLRAQPNDQVNTILNDSAIQSKSVMQLGIEIYKLGNYLDAAEVFRESFSLDTNNLEALIWVGKSYLNSKKKEKSLKYLLKAYEKAPDFNPNIHLFLARAYQANKEMVEAGSMYFKYQISLKKQYDNESLSKRKYKKALLETVDFMSSYN